MSAGKSEAVSVRVGPHINAALQVAAEREMRTLANMLEVTVVAYCRKMAIRSKVLQDRRSRAPRPGSVRQDGLACIVADRKSQSTRLQSARLVTAHMLAFAPGSRAVIRDEEWLIRRVDPSTDGGWLLACDGISDLVRGQDALFLTQLEDQIAVLDP
jgi:hypothetical protein